ncbi:MAG: hypothetical protein K2H89_12020 [Oscillospiraceae bacterium]|nr:hypothetical protein [Oscillospiraceae bacterium]
MIKNKNSVQKLIGFEMFTKYGIRTDKAELAFFCAEPVNISVLSAANIASKIQHLTMILSVIPELELIALDSCESFDSNKIYIQKRLQKEKNPAVRKLLEADYNFLDEVQVEMSSARQFLFAVRFHKEKEEQIFHLLNQADRALAEHGFLVRRMTKSEIKRMLALYFGTNLSGEDIPDIEGENYLETEGFHAKEEVNS